MIGADLKTVFRAVTYTLFANADVFKIEINKQ